MDRYIVVTLGPIFETINAATTPAALWIGSYLFSYLNKTLCQLFVREGVKEEDILTPYFDTKDAFTTHNGVGLYHDRIVFRAGDFSISRFPAIRDEAVYLLSQDFNLDYDFLHSYLMIRAAETEAENPILDTGSLLDCLELAKPIVIDMGSNPLHNLMHRNSAIRSLPLVQNIPNWQLSKGEHLKSIEEICGFSLGTGMAKHRHFALVRADGDHMGQLLSRSGSKDVRDFSRRCISYCDGIAGLVHDFGGIAIYAGGDDLLALLPCENQRGENIFDFVKSANDLFARCFAREAAVPEATLSFGITICHLKTPLRTALEDSQRMLFRLAKSHRGCTVLHWLLHSEQAECLLIPHGALDMLTPHLRQLIARWDYAYMFHNKLTMYRSMFLKAGNNLAAIANLFRNIFEGRVFINNTFVQDTTPRFYHQMLTESGIKSVLLDSDDDLELTQEGVDTYCCLLQLTGLLADRGGAEE